MDSIWGLFLLSFTFSLNLWSSFLVAASLLSFCKSLKIQHSLQENFLVKANQWDRPEFQIQFFQDSVQYLQINRSNFNTTFLIHVNVMPSSSQNEAPFPYSKNISPLSPGHTWSTLKRVAFVENTERFQTCEFTVFEHICMLSKAHLAYQQYCVFLSSKQISPAHLSYRWHELNSFETPTHI